MTLCTSASSLACACSLLLLDRLHPLFLFDPADQMAHTGAMFERPGKLSDYIKSPYVVSTQATHDSRVVFLFMLVIEMVSTRRCLVWERLAWEQRWLHVVGS